MKEMDGMDANENMPAEGRGNQTIHIIQPPLSFLSLTITHE
jgi:hypothetical protein